MPTISLAKKYKEYFGNHDFKLESIKSFLFFLVALVVNFYAGMYATSRASNHVSDIILSNLRVYNVDDTFVYTTFAFVIFTVLLIVMEPRRLPFMLNSIATFTIIRSGFISLTHIGPYPSQIAIDSYILSYFVFGADLFFSGHTGLPFLFALIFWNEKAIRNIFLCISVFFGILVLVAHLHYSIDVASAFFISYTIYHISGYLFKKNKILFEKGL